MRVTLRLLALVMALVVIALWFFGGPNLGWTKDQVGHPLKDSVTGIETTVFEKRWVPGVDFLAEGLIVAGALAGMGCLFGPSKRNKTGGAAQKI